MEILENNKLHKRSLWVWKRQIMKTQRKGTQQEAICTQHTTHIHTNKYIEHVPGKPTRTNMREKCIGNQQSIQNSQAAKYVAK